MENPELNNFKKWLANRGLSVSSIQKYSSQANKRIIKELGIDFYDVKSLDSLRDLLLAVKEMEANMPKDPKRMYSAAVSNYIKYKTELFNHLDTMNDYQYLTDIEKAFNINEESSDDYDFKPQTKRIQTVNNRYLRNPLVGKEAIMKANYLCQHDSSHQFFISKATHHNYVEAHHLIPIAYQALFTNGIDVVENVVALCPVCHRCIHYGINEQRKSILTHLYKNSEEKLYRAGIDVRLKELFELYEM